MHRPELPAPQIPDYTVLRRIGGGSYGDVWLARGLTGSYYAVKVVHRQTFDQDRPFEREFAGIKNYEAVSRSHESQVPILHVGGNAQEGCFYYVMELADDQETGREILPVLYKPRTLQSEMQQHGRLPVEECIRIGLALATALGHIHRHGLVHRDIKPSNIIFINGIPRLADPGLVTAASDAPSFVGTEGFLPPEGPGSPQADVYSLGKVLYEIAMGRDRKRFPEIPTALHEWPDHQQLIELNEVILKACHTDPEQRYRSAEELHADLALLQTGKSLIRLRAMSRQFAVLKRAALPVVLLAGLAWLAWLQASRSAASSRQLLSRFNAERGQQLAQAQDWGGALAWYMEALKLSQPTAARDVPVHHMRISLAMAQCPALAGLFVSPGPLRQVALNQDESLLIAHVGDRTVSLWPIESRRPGQTAIHVDSVIHKLALHPREPMVAAACADGQVRVWNTRTQQALPLILKHPAAVTDVQFNAEGTLLTTVCLDGLARVWSISDGAICFQTPPQSHPLQLAALSPDGRILFTAFSWQSATNAGSEAQLWLLEGKTLAGQRITHLARMNTACFDSHSRSVLTVSDDHTGRIWDALTGQPVTPLLKHGGPVLYGAFSPDGRFVATTGADQVARVWESQSGRLRYATMPHGGAVTFLAFRQDGSAFATCSLDQTACIWDAATGQRLCPPLRHGSPVEWAAFDHAGNRLFTACQDRTVRVWDLRSSQFHPAEISLPRPLLDMDIDGMASLAAVSFSTNANHGTAIVADLKHGGILPSSIHHDAPIWRVRFSPDRARLLTVSADRTARLWSTQNGTPLLHTLTNAYPVWAGEFDGHGRRVATSGGNNQQQGEVRLWDVTTGKLLLPPIQHDHEVMAVCFSRDGQWVATGCGSEQGPGQWRLLDAATGHDRFPPVACRRAVWQVALHPAEPLLATASLDYTVRLWNMRTGQPVCPPLEHAGWINRILFSTDGQYLLSTSADGLLRLWDAHTGTPVHGPMKHSGAVLCGAFNDNNEWIASASVRGGVLLWHAASGESVNWPFPYPAEVTHLFFASNPDRLITASRDQKIRIWTWPWCTLEPAKLEQQAALRSGVRVTSKGTLEPWKAASLQHFLEAP